MRLTLKLFGICLLLFSCETKKPEFKLEHFKAYSLEDTDIAKYSLVIPKDQFTGDRLWHGTIRVYHEPKFLSNPVSKNREGLKDTSAHLAWYRVTPDTLWSDRDRIVDYRNQFTAYEKRQLKTGKVRYLLAASEKVEFGSVFPKNLDSFLCYEVMSSDTTVSTHVRLEDQFLTEETNAVGPVLFCNPVFIAGQPIQNEEDHLVWYILGPEATDFATRRGLKNIFHDPPIMVRVTSEILYLGVPTKKDGFEVVPKDTPPPWEEKH